MTMIDRGFIVKEALAPWAVLLEEWCLLYERYCRMLEGKDSPCFN
jgi:hypothetical protein